MAFKLNDTLEKDSHYITELKLCQVRLMDNSNYPWLILVPMKNDIIEITDFDKQDYDLFNDEVRTVAQILKNEFKPDKLNIATIGNVVPQLHMHVIGRFKNDKLFPKPVWGGQFTRYDDDSLKNIISILRQALKE